MGKFFECKREHRRGSFRGQAEEKTDSGTQLRKRPGVQGKTKLAGLTG